MTFFFRCPDRLKMKVCHINWDGGSNCFCEFRSLNVSNAELRLDLPVLHVVIFQWLNLVKPNNHCYVAT